MKREHYILLGGGGLLLWLFLRGKNRCPLNSVMRWQNLAQEISRDNYNVYGTDTTAQILTLIQDQSQGDPNQVYYAGGVWKRYGLCGVPLAWAQAFNPDVKPVDLLNPSFNIDIALKIIAYIDARIMNAYRAGGVSGPFQPGLSSNAYSAYYHSNTMDITDARDPNIHNRQTRSRYIDILNCYRDVIGS